MRLAAALAAGVLAGVPLGVGATALLDGDGSGSGQPIRGGGRLDVLPSGPVTVHAETVRLAAGFESRHVHGGPTFNLVRSGRLEIEDERGLRRYGAGDVFFEPGDAVHTIRVLEDARLDVVRLLPPGADETTEVP